MLILTPLLNRVNQIIWGNWLLFVLLGIGLLYTVLSGFVQIRHFPYIIRKTLLEPWKTKRHASSDSNSISSFQALCTAVASCVGSGNIVGVSTAVLAGGLGAIFWMWVAAFVGMATKYGEIILGLLYRVKNEDGTYSGGPMYYIRDGLHAPVLASLCAFFMVIQIIGGNFIQSNTISSVMKNHLHIPEGITGVILVILIFTISAGGLKRLARITQKLVPAMALLYVVSGLVIILLHITSLPDVILNIVTEAFGLRPVLAGTAGSMIIAMQKGIARGLYSNEAGEGSAPVIHSAANVQHPVEQGITGVTEVFLDTFVICTISDHQFLSLSWNKNTGGLSGPLITMLQESARYLMIATGMTLVISTAGIDLSVGSVMAVAGAAAMQMLTSGVNVWLAIFLALLIGLGVGCINGALVSILGLQPFITTLIMMLAGRGLAKVITSGQNTDASSVAGGAPLKWMANGFILGIPANFVIALVIVALIGLLCRKTAMGMMVESVGINPEASRMTGIKPKKILFLVYAISGLLAAVAGLFATASVMRVDVVKTGQDLEMYAILAVVIGGTSLLGGKFSLAGSALGAVIIAMIRKTIITLGIDSAATPAFFAVVVIVICVMQAPKIHNLGAEIKRKCALKTQTKAVAA